MVEDWLVILCIWCLSIIAGIAVGYAIATKESLTAVQSIERCINNTNSNDWVHYEMYKELEEKYNNLVKDHERYRGMIQAIKDCKGGENE